VSKPLPPEPSRDGQALDLALTRRFVRYIRPYRGRMGVALGLLFLSGAMELVGPYLTKVAIDDAIPAGDTGLLLRVVGAFLVVLVAEFAAGYVQTLIMTRAGQSIMRDLRVELFTHLQKMGLRYFDRNPVGRVVTRLTSDVETLNELLTSGLVTIIADVFTLVGITAVLFWMDARLALITYAVLPPLLLASFYFRRVARDGFRTTRERVGRLNGILQETFSGIEVVKLFGREALNPDMDLWLKQLVAEPELVRRIPIARKAQAKMAADLPYLPLWYWKNAIIIRREAHDPSKPMPPLSLSGSLEPLSRIH
jgi:ATP-binding cassette subfamily B protein